jgi:hypothetical protein
MRQRVCPKILDARTPRLIQQFAGETGKSLLHQNSPYALSIVPSSSVHATFTGNPTGVRWSPAGSTFAAWVVASETDDPVLAIRQSLGQQGLFRFNGLEEFSEMARGYGKSGRMILMLPAQFCRRQQISVGLRRRPGLSPSKRVIRLDR